MNTNYAYAQVCAQAWIMYNLHTCTFEGHSKNKFGKCNECPEIILKYCGVDTNTIKRRNYTSKLRKMSCYGLAAILLSNQWDAIEKYKNENQPIEIQITAFPRKKEFGELLGRSLESESARKKFLRDLQIKYNVLDKKRKEEKEEEGELNDENDSTMESIEQSDEEEEIEKEEGEEENVKISKKRKRNENE